MKHFKTNQEKLMIMCYIVHMNKKILEDASLRPPESSWILLVYCITNFTRLDTI